MPSPIRIAIFGTTGSGKTSFINCATGTDLGVGHEADSATKNIQQAVVPSDKVGQRKVILVDTPGFSDTDLEDPQLFLKIANWIAKSHNSGEPLNGAIFLQSISQPRVVKSEKDAVELFEKIVGSQAFPQVVVASSMWDTLKYSATGNKNENSSLEIVRQFLNFPQTTFQLVEELRKSKGLVWDTSAGTFLKTNLDVRIQQTDEQIRIVGNTTARLKKTLARLKEWARTFTTATIAGTNLVWTTMKVGGSLLQDVLILVDDFLPYMGN
ncbi:P-loop containing nucleoside triphosphate hydrolase protein [Hypoxylon argillaceum]|nr:P-loop containing nucleoside triphosphate hydrolase protein [Hypoxylon argillaceum]